MASLDSNYGRLCKIKDIGSTWKDPKVVKAIFHEWFAVTKCGESYIYGLVEYENGRMGTLPPGRIRFVDGKCSRSWAEKVHFDNLDDIEDGSVKNE